MHAKFNSLRFLRPKEISLPILFLKDREPQAHIEHIFFRKILRGAETVLKAVLFQL